VCKNFIQIGWGLAVRGPKTCFGVKTETGKPMSTTVPHSWRSAVTQRSVQCVAERTSTVWATSLSLVVSYPILSNTCLLNSETEYRIHHAFGRLSKKCFHQQKPCHGDQVGCPGGWMHLYSVLRVPSLCLSSRPMLVLCRNEWTYRHTFWQPGKGIVLVFWTLAPLKIQRGTLIGAFNVRGVGKFCKYCPLPWKRYEIGP